MKSSTQIIILSVLAGAASLSMLGAHSAGAAKINDVLAKENKAMLLSRLRAIPDLRSATTYKEYAAKKISQNIAANETRVK